MEASGDATATWELIARDLADREDENFWRPERMRRLLQLVLFGPLLPRWATSRWILEQAAQSLDPRGRARALKAMKIAIETRGGEGTLVGTDDLDARAKVIDHDWVHRQLLLYEFGALQDFLARIASSELLARADRVHGWARTPMGGFRFVRESPHTLTWQNLATRTECESLNLGTASLLEPGECAIGRLVPIEGGAMFETAPLFVPDEVARQVAEDPSEWVAAVSAECRRERPPEQRIRTGGHDFRLLTDVPTGAQLLMAYSVMDRAAEESSPLTVAPDPVAVQAALVRAALDGEVGTFDHVLSPWPAVAASLLEPSVFVELCSSLVPADGAKLTVLADEVAGPARAVCLSLAEDLEQAA